MSNKRSQVKKQLPAQPHPQPTAAPARSFRWNWLGVGLVLVAGIGIGAFLWARNRDTGPAAPPNPPSAEDADIEPAPPPGPAPEGMVWIPGGTFWMGDEDSPDHDAPSHRVAVSGFWMDRTEVTNAQYAKFVAATGYRTVAERAPTREQYPNAPPEMLVPGSAVFHSVEASLDPRTWSTQHPPWWGYERGACWNHPEGPGSTITGRENHPVVHIAWEDAEAYAKWAGKRLPTEAEWEFAARGGLDRQPFCWGGSAPGAEGKFHGNTWQGPFPGRNTTADGFGGTAPVGSFPPNGYGLYDMSGNAWEWCADWYDPQYYPYSPKRNPKGPAEPASFDQGQPQRVRRGGSFLCTDEYCSRYRPGTRDKNPPESGASHTGFRCVKTGPE